MSRFLRGVVAACASALAASAQMTWSSYDSSGNRVSANAATFDPATGTYSLTIPANGSRVFVTTNFVPLTVTTPATGRTLVPVSFAMRASGGYGTGGSVQNKYTGFGLFDNKGTAPAATGNFTDDTGLWFAVYQQSNASYNSRPFGVKAVAPACPVNLLGVNTTNYGLGTARGGTGGVMVDNQLINVVLTPIHNSAGTWQLGNSTSATATSTSAPGVLMTDAATGGTALQRTTYSDTSTSLSGPQTFNQFGFLFENGTGSAVTLSLSNFSLVGPPWVVTQPPSAPSVTAGGSLTLSITASGSPSTYQWEFSNNGGSSYAPISGANTADYTINNADSSNAGLYRVVVSNAAGSSTSSSADVSVTSSAVAPSVQTAPSGATILVGGSHTFNVLANGTTPLSYQWQVSTNGVDYTDISGATSSSYTVSPAVLADNATYRVVITNVAGSVTSTSAALAVHQVPAISVQPVGTVTTDGAAYTLGVTATGYPAPTYQWKLNDVAVAGATSADLPLTVSASTAGAYTVTVTNAAGSVTSASVYVGFPTSLAASYFPASAGVDTNIDTPLSVSFPSAPVVGQTGQVRVYNAATNALVETIDLATLTVKRSGDVRLTPQRVYRVASRTIGGLLYNYFPIVVSGNTARIYLKTPLAYGASYYVQIDPGVILDSTGATLPALTGTGAWTFSTKAVGPAAGATALTVAADGSGDFTTVQGAIDFIPFSPANTIPRAITVRNGTYTELVHVRTGQNLVSIRGESRAGTVIAYLNNGDIYPAQSIYHRGVFLTEGNDFRLENLTIRNLTPRYGSQAEAFLTNVAIQRCTVSRVNLYSLQDTIFASKQVFFTDCYVEGDVDYMWGEGGCFFQNTELRMMNAGHQAQVRNAAGNPGNVYVNCRLTADPSVAAATGTLGRIDPAGYPTSQIVYIGCAIGPHIKATGWQLDNGTTAPNVRFWEYGSTDLAGAPLNISSRPTYNAIATGVGGSTVLPNQQIDLATADALRVPVATVGFTPAVAPEIDTHPVGAALNEGGATTLSVSATLGYPLATYQWYKDGSPIAGATTATLLLNPAVPADAGVYTVVLTNTAGTATSAGATVSVTPNLSPYEQFIFDTGLDPLTSGLPDANPSGDGIANVLKFVLGGDPTLPQPGLIRPATIEDVAGTPMVTFAFNRNIVATASLASFAVEQTSNLQGTWAPIVDGVGGATVTVTPGLPGYEHVVVRLPLTSAPTYLRLVAVLPEPPPAGGGGIGRPE